MPSGGRRRPRARGGGTGAAPTPPARRAAAFRESRWRCGPLPPSRGSRPPPALGPGRCGAQPAGEGAREAGKTGGPGMAGPANPRGISAAAERPPRRLPRPDPHPGPCGLGRERGPRQGRQPGKLRADPRKEEWEAGRAKPAGGGRGPRRGMRARGGWGGRLGPPQGWEPRKTRLPRAGGGGGRAGVRGRGAGHRARGIRGAGGGAQSRVPGRGGP